MTIPADVEELDDSPRYTFDRSGGEGTRHFKLLWADLADFLELLIPPSFLEGSTVVTPHAATFPGLPWLTAHSVSVNPFGAILDDPNFPATYTHAEVLVTYRTEEYGSGTEGPGGTSDSLGTATTFVSQKVSVGGEFMSWPNGALQFAAPADGTTNEEGSIDAARSEDSRSVPEDQTIGVIVPSVEHSLTWHFCPYPPWRAIRSMVGCVNAYTFNGCPPETLLFLGAEATRELTNTGVRAWSLEYKFAEKSVDCVRADIWKGWNHFLRSNGLGIGRWELVDRKPPLMFCRNHLAISLLDPEKWIWPVGGRWIESFCESFYVELRDGTQTAIYRVDSSEDFTGNIYSTDAGVTDNQVGGKRFGITWQRGFPDNTEGSWSINQFVKQFIWGSFARPVGRLDTWVEVRNGSWFPDVGQFFFWCERNAEWDQRERMLVVQRRVSSGTNEWWRVLRGVRTQEYTDPLFLRCTTNNPYLPESAVAGLDDIGALEAGASRQVEHNEGDWVVLEKMPLYPMDDFRYLFQSGLATG